MKLVFTWSILLITIQARLHKDSPNVKTVLFTPSDLQKNCWNHREISLLRIRKAMQDLIPKYLPNDLVQLLKYLKDVQQIVENDGCENRNNDTNVLIRQGISDTVGGYLQAVALPVAKERYYSGVLNYDTMSQLQDLLDDIKEKLGTDGASWSRQIDARKFNKKVSALEFTGDSMYPCHALFVNDNCPEGKPKIPLPYFDDDEYPSAIALPLKFRNLYPLRHPSSTQILLKYYILSVKCLDRSDQDLITFNRALHEWITDKVYPRLYDVDQWYAGFSGVLRILESMRQKGLTSPVYPVKVNKRNLTDLESSLSKKSNCYNNESHSTDYSTLLLLFPFLMLMLCVMSWYLYSIVENMKKSRYSCDVGDSEMADAMLSFYCGLREARQQNDSRYGKLGAEPSSKKTGEKENESSNNYKPGFGRPTQDTSNDEDEGAEPTYGRTYYPTDEEDPQTTPELKRVGFRPPASRLPEHRDKRQNGEEVPSTTPFTDRHEYLSQMRQTTNSPYTEWAVSDVETETSVDDN